ncbi:MAG: DMT family protein [Planctomycetes bacterium]|nr:DMT family protein [Planctomycetota bacterium]
MRTVILLTISNVFMTFAWYGHLKFKDSPLWIAILVSWLIAFVEYCFQVPANRIGHLRFTAPQLKVMQEVITLVVFCAFCVLYLREPIRWNYMVGFGLIVAAVAVVFGFDTRPNAAQPPEHVSSPAAEEGGATVDAASRAEAVLPSEPVDLL